MNPLTNPKAPFMSPASGHKFCVRSTRAPVHMRSSASIPLKSSAFIFVTSTSALSFGTPWRAQSVYIGTLVRSASCFNFTRFMWSAPVSPVIRVFRPSISNGAFSNFSRSARPSGVICNTVRLRRANHARSSGVHVQSAMPCVTRRKSAASLR